MNERHHLYDFFDSELCLIGAENEAGLIAEARKVMRFIELAPQTLLEDIAYTCACRAGGQKACVAFVVSSAEELRHRLELTVRKLTDGVARIRDKSGTYYFREPVGPTGKIAFLFPGTTSFYPDMLRNLAINYEDVREAFDELEEAMTPQEHVSVLRSFFEHLKPGEKPTQIPVTDRIVASDYIFPPAPCYRESEKEPTDVFAEAFSAAHTADLAMFRLLRQIALKPDGLAGVSGGEFAALDVAGVYGKLAREKRVEILREGYEMLGKLVQRDDLPDCAMMTVLDAPCTVFAKLTKSYPGRIAVATIDSPRQRTLALSPEIADEVLTFLQAAGAKILRVPMKHPFSTPWCAKVLPTIRQFLSHWVRHAPGIPVYSCATAAKIPDNPKEILKLVSDQWASPLRFAETIRRMYADGYRVFIEAGARGNMTTAVDEVLKADLHVAVATDRLHRSSVTQLNHALAMLAAQGVRFDLTQLHSSRRQSRLDFDGGPSSRFLVPGNAGGQVSLAGPENAVANPSLRAEDAGQALLLSGVIDAGKAVSKPAATAPAAGAAPAKSESKGFGFDFPMLLGAEILEEEPGVRLALSKVISLADYPFLEDYAIGSSQVSFANAGLHGLAILSLASGLEIMAEAARRLAPSGSRVTQIDSLRSARWIGFERGAVKINIRAERIAWQDAAFVAVKVQLREDTPNNAYTWPVIEATILLNLAGEVQEASYAPTTLTNPRQVNWSAGEIYPDRLFQGGALQCIRHVNEWSMEGINFDFTAPLRTSAVRFTRIPLFTVWPQLLDVILSAFPLWRSHEKFYGAVSLPFRARKITFHTPLIHEGARLKGYLRLTAVTPRSHVANICATDETGRLLVDVRGWEEICERVPSEYHTFIQRPTERFVSKELPASLLGNPAVPLSTAVIADLPVKLFEENQGIWVRSLAFALLSPEEREDWLDMQGSTARKVEWLLGRAAAKEATRRFLLKQYQSRWTSADVRIWADDSGKPHPIGPWHDLLSASAGALDLSIAHTSKLIVAAVSAHSRIGLDIEAIGRDLTDEFIQGVFTPVEMDLAAKTGEGPIAMLKFWCAKEAISKALGTGIRYSPQDLRITAADPVTGLLQIELMNQWLDAFKGLRGKKTAVQTAVFSGHAFAFCLLPITAF